MSQRNLILLWSLIGLAGCAAPYPASDLRQPAISADAGSALVQVERGTSFVGVATGFSFLVDGVPALNLPSNGASGSVTVPAGPVVLGLACGGWPQTVADLPLVATPGYTYQVAARTGINQTCTLHLERILPPGSA